MNATNLTIHEPSEAVRSLVAALKVFDPDMAQHLLATSVLAARVGEQLDLDSAAVENCRIGALLHDVGMLGVDQAIISYPGMPADVEWDVLMEHAALGGELLASIPSLAHLAPIVRAHHERIDGSGYPDALIGDEIPIEARVIAVADTFHVMTIPVPYRRASSTSQAMDELVGNSGSQFDERVVEAFGVTVNYRRRLRRA